MEPTSTPTFKVFTTSIVNEEHVVFEYTTSPDPDVRPAWEPWGSQFRRISPKTMAIAIALRDTGFTSITMHNVHEVITRVSMLWDAGKYYLTIPYEDTRLPHQISAHDIMCHVGMEINGIESNLSKFLNNLYMIKLEQVSRHGTPGS